MSTQAFRKALSQQPLSQEERDALTTDELFVLVLARRLDHMTAKEQEGMQAADRHYLASVGLIPGESEPICRSRDQKVTPSPPLG